MALVLQNNLLEDMLDNEEQLSEQMDALPYLVGAQPAWCTALNRHRCTAGCRSELVDLLSRLHVSDSATRMVLAACLEVLWCTYSQGKGRGHGMMLNSVFPPLPLLCICRFGSSTTRALRSSCS